jgi:hypothetical protein
MANKRFTPSLDLLSQSISLVRQHFIALLWLVFLPALLLNLGQLQVVRPILQNHQGGETLTLSTLYQDIVGSATGISGLVLIGIALIWSTLVFPAIIVGTLRAAQGKTFDPIHALGGSWHYFWRVIGLVLLTGLIVELGLILFIIPGVIALRMLLLAPYYLVDRDLSIIQAMKLSADQSKPAALPIYGVISVLLWIVVGGAILGVVPIVGVILSLSVSYLFIFGPALRYVELRRLSGAKKITWRRRTS